MGGVVGGNTAGGVHPVAEAAAAIVAALDAVADCPFCGLGPDQAGGLLASVVAVESRCGRTPAPTGWSPGGR